MKLFVLIAIFASVLPLARSDCPEDTAMFFQTLPEGPVTQLVNGVNVTNGAIFLNKGVSQLGHVDTQWHPTATDPIILTFPRTVNSAEVELVACGIRGEGAFVEAYNAQDELISTKSYAGDGCGRMSSSLYDTLSFKLAFNEPDTTSLRIYYKLNSTPCHTIGQCNYGVVVRSVNYHC
ncbi:hypothetical protein K7432_017455 [Basidiobolus ranarum]|uniref:Uncharacterized protein n=1 Tax=Basidiobolus ranarum TaxID=34480 RepID=A0ABR2VKL3_9FUNG